MEINKPVASIIIFIIALIVALLFVLPQYRESLALGTSLTQKEAEYSGKSSYYITITKLLQDIESRQASLDKIETALPADFSIAPLVYFLNKKAAETGSTLTSVVFLQPSENQYRQNTDEALKQEIKNVVFTVDLTGNYQGLKKFLTALESSARLFEVQTISFTSAKPISTAASKNQPPMYNFKLQLQTNSY